ncbi:MAG: hypothetical protein AAGE76_13625 [Pseudomonadota bacterium]
MALSSFVVLTGSPTHADQALRAAPTSCSTERKWFWNNRLTTLAGFILFVLLPVSGNSEHLVHGSVEGWFCRGFLIEKCSVREIQAFSDVEDGEPFELNASFSRVDDYSESQERHWLESRAPFYHAFGRDVDGSWDYLGVPDSITFRCNEVE